MIKKLLYNFGFYLIHKYSPYSKNKSWVSTYRDMVTSRLRFRVAKNYANADRIKNVLVSHGIEIHEDGVSYYTIWGRKEHQEKETTWVNKYE